MHTRRTMLKLLGATAAAGGVLAGCERLPTGTPRPATEPTELVLGHFVSTSHEYHAQVLEPWARQVEAQSAGRLRITIHPGGALGPAPAQYTNVVSGAMDIGFGVQSYTPGRFPLTEGLELPFQWVSAAAATDGLHALYRATPALRDEYREVKVLALWTNGPAQLLTTRKPVRALEDVRGLKIRSPGASHNKTIEALGGSALSMPVSEMYDALERGVATATISAPSVFTSFKLVDIVRYSAVARFTVACFFLVMNLDRWRSLSTAEQRLLEETTGDVLALRAAQVGDETDRSATDVARAKGIEFVELGDDEVARWQHATRGVSDQWIREVEARGLPGQQLHQELMHLARAQVTA